MKILIADDSLITRLVISRELQVLGISIETIDESINGIDAHQKAIEESKIKPYELIFMDWSMPEMIGIDALIKIRDANVKSPVIMLTTDAEKNNNSVALQAGANHYLKKPFNRINFQSAVKQVIDDLS
jgi:two-component system, chemotaxis family, chemotaxis protein CheY